MKISKSTIAACAASILIACATNSDAFNYIYLQGKGVGGEMSCSDWNKRNITSAERSAMMQWIFGFISGYDAAIRPNPSNGGLNGQPIGNLIIDQCKKYPKADLVSVANNIAEYVQREINGEVSQPIVLNRGAGPPPQPDPGSWLIVRNASRNTCTVIAGKPRDSDAVILTSFKAYVIGSKAMKDMVVAECGCEKSCNLELPR
jgi:hypothetical protein